jgi:hypothetical protein
MSKKKPDEDQSGPNLTIQSVLAVEINPFSKECHKKERKAEAL